LSINFAKTFLIVYCSRRAPSNFFLVLSSAIIGLKSISGEPLPYNKGFVFKSQYKRDGDFSFVVVAII
jgi:hypothetical protein